eukprot:PhM_4_TR4392/c0_g1_i1/m.62698/K03284/corA; magnesium transporter
MTDERTGLLSDMDSSTGLASPPNESADVGPAWHALLCSGTALSEEHAEAYAQMFAAHDVPAPSADMLTFLSHTMLESIGITKAGHRARILYTARAFVQQIGDGNYKDETVLSMLMAAKMKALSPPGSDSTMRAGDGVLNNNIGCAAWGGPSSSPGLRRRRVHDAVSSSAHRRDPNFMLSQYRVYHKQFQSSTDFVWECVVGRDARLNDVLNTLQGKYSLHPRFMKTCTSSQPVPQILTAGTSMLVLLRFPVVHPPEDADSMQQITNRLVLITDTEKKYVITYHRVDNPFMALLRADWDSAAADSPYGSLTQGEFVREVIDSVFRQYHDSLRQCEELLDHYESRMLENASIHENVRRASSRGYSVPLASLKKRRPGSSGAEVVNYSFYQPTAAAETVATPHLPPHHHHHSKKNDLVTRLYHLQRRASILLRIIELSHGVTSEALDVVNDPYARDVLDSVDALHNKVEFLHENCENLLNLHLALLSNRTNELTRLLTLFSSFFCPLTIITGVYGMNFEAMPELQWEWGYGYAAGVMFVSVMLIYVLVHRLGMM